MAGAKASSSDLKQYERLKEAEAKKNRTLTYAILFLLVAQAAVTRYFGGEIGAASFLLSLVAYWLGYRYAAAIGEINLATFALTHAVDNESSHDA